MKINQNQIFGKTHTQFSIDEKLWLVEGEECWETVGALYGDLTDIGCAF